MSSPVTPQLLAVARGDEPADLLLLNGRVVNVFTRTIEAGSIAICGDRIAGVGDYSKGRQIIELRECYVTPGFIDAHMHVESTMMPPSQFVRLALPHGTTGAVLDPHEIANVMGAAGIRLIMDDACGLPMNLMFAISSCVPASPLETSGARLEAVDLQPLLEDSRVVALAEMMNFPGVINGNASVLAKLNMVKGRFVIDGHAPDLRGRPLQAYVAGGISSDHECTTAEEAAEKLRLGMRIFIREGSAARNLEALLPLVKESNAHRFCFCTDDRHPADLINEGHIDHVVRRAIAMGAHPATAVAIASLHTAQHYGRTDRGAIAPGYFADMVVCDDLKTLQARQVYYEGRMVAADGAMIESIPDRTQSWSSAHRRVHLPDSLEESSLAIRAPSDPKMIRVIAMRPYQLLTGELAIQSRIIGGCYVSDPARDILKIAVIERHHATGNIGRGFVHGFGLKRGAIASTVGHDSHNLAVLGASDGDMVLAAKTLAQVGGGQCVTADGRVLAVLALPLAGLMSDEPVNLIVQQQRALHDAARSIGCAVEDPFMPLSFMPLAVIPRLKLTDLGLVDVERFKIVPLEI